MTTHEDWIFRARVLRQRAAALRRQARALIIEAISFEHSADGAEQKAVDGAITNLENAVGRNCSISSTDRTNP